MTKFKVPEEKPDAVSQMRAQSIIKRVQQATAKIAFSALPKKLRKRFTPEELEAAYLFQSFDSYAETAEPLTRSSFVHMVEHYKELADFMIEIRRSHFEMMMDEIDDDRAA